MDLPLSQSPSIRFEASPSNELPEPTNVLHPPTIACERRVHTGERVHTTTGQCIRKAYERTSMLSTCGIYQLVMETCPWRSNNARKEAIQVHASPSVICWHCV